MGEGNAKMFSNAIKASLKSAKNIACPGTVFKKWNVLTSGKIKKSPRLLKVHKAHMKSLKPFFLT